MDGASRDAQPQQEFGPTMEEYAEAARLPMTRAPAHTSHLSALRSRPQLHAQVRAAVEQEVLAQLLQELHPESARRGPEEELEDPIPDYFRLLIDFFDYSFPFCSFALDSI